MSTETQDYCEGVRILIARMETNPEDFELYGNARFRGLAQTLEMGLRNREEMEVYQDWKCLHKREQDAIMQAYREMGRRRFSKSIMKTLLDGELEMVQPKPKSKKILLNPAQVELLKKYSNEDKERYLEEITKWASY